MIMLGVSNYGAFVLAFILLLILPGPGNLALITSTGKGGIRAGLAATFGIILGDQVLLWLAVAGVAALLKAYPAAFHIVQWLGTAYLVWLGARMVFSHGGSTNLLNIRPSHFLRQALSITLLNPKAILFYMAFFPLFIDPAHHLGFVTFAFMALTVAVLTFIYGLLMVLAAHLLAERLRASPLVSRLLEKIAGLFLIGFGVKLASG